MSAAKLRPAAGLSAASHDHDTDIPKLFPQLRRQLQGEGHMQRFVNSALHECDADTVRSFLMGIHQNIKYSHDEKRIPNQKSSDNTLISLVSGASSW
jgi:hypothetical protein